MVIRDCYDALGADYDAAYRHLLNEDRIKKYAIKFSDSMWCQKIKDAYAVKAYNDIFELSHDIKGVTSTLGFTRLYELSDALCDNLRTGKPDEKTESMVNELVEECIKTHDLLSICE